MIAILLFASGVLLSSATLIDFVAVGERRYYCSDGQRWVGDCEDEPLRPGADGYGYRRDEGVGVGRGYYTLPTDYDAELVCDFGADGGVSDDVTNIAWLRVSDGGLWSSPSRLGTGRTGGRRGRRLRRGVYDSQYRHSNVVRTRGGRSTYYIRDFTAADFGTYRCFGTSSGDRVVFMEVDFSPDRLSGGKVTDIVFTAENAF
ncbi:hypothetical protein FJT64_008548 [Amphibalanus amphitrite]|uniref:Ig-like domain-containing protein n=1 Tax=Amphibalanus amphitrite TaxID=1232801 RepID=A0A6A4VL11_AMPAM|nr:hypothetical protein FJT64_008548 [Amphibalanus amphitrite]